MAHEIENMMYVGEVPWHALGTKLENPSIDEAIVAAGLDWKVGTKELFTAESVKVPALATYRETDNKVLGVVGPDYKVLQNRDAFQFFQPFLDNNEAKLETAGSLREGQRIWIQAKINREDSIIVPKSDDRVEKYILLSNSHDGTMAVRVGYTPVRTVCNNTLQMALNHKGSQLIRVRHCGDVAANLEEIRKVMDVANAQFEATAEQYRFLASKEINLTDLEKYIKVVFATKKQLEEAAGGEDLRAGERVMSQVVQLFEGGKGNDMPGVKGTYWAAYNAITEYVQYFRGENPMTRLDNLWFGSGAQLNKKALEKATEMALVA